MTLLPVDAKQMQLLALHEKLSDNGRAIVRRIEDEIWAEQARGWVEVDGQITNVTEALDIQRIYDLLGYATQIKQEEGYYTFLASWVHL